MTYLSQRQRDELVALIRRNYYASGRFSESITPEAIVTLIGPTVARMIEGGNTTEEQPPSTLRPYPRRRRFRSLPGGAA